MRIRHIALLTALISVLLAGSLQARDIFVDFNNGDNLIGDGSQSAPYRNITYALLYAPEPVQAYDTIFLEPGTYNTLMDEYGFREIFPISIPNAVTITSVSGSSSDTILDATLENRNVLEVTNVTTSCSVLNIKLTGGLLNGINVYKSNNVTLSGCFVEANGQGGINIQQSQGVDVWGSLIQLNQNGSGLSVLNSSGLSIFGNTITQNIAINGGGISLFKSTDVTIANNTITNNLARNEGPLALGGGISVQASDAYITDNTITGNEASSRYNSQGGGIYCGPYYSPVPDEPDDIDPRTITINSGNVLEDNKANNGGGICVELYNATISGCAVQQNTASERGGGICTIDNSPTITNNLIDTNSARNGGGLSAQGADPNSIALIQGNDFLNNTASSTGGAVSATQNIVQLYTNKYIGNSAVRGGAVFLDQTIGMAEIRGYDDFENNITVDFKSNSASEDGGAVYVSQSLVDIVDCIFETNTADSTAGAVRFDEGKISRCKIISNQAQRYAGVYSNGIVENCIFETNTNIAGGGIVLSDYVYNNTFQSNKIQAGAGGDVEARDGDFIINNIFSQTDNGVGISENSGNIVPFVGNNCFYNNELGVYLESETVYIPNVQALPVVSVVAANNIQQNPEFVQPVSPAADLKLKSTSPCIDAGRSDSIGMPEPLPGDDIIKVIRPVGAAYDIGAYEYNGTPSTAAFVYQYDFDVFEQGWRSSPQISSFLQPEMKHEPGKLVMTSGDNVSTFGYMTAAAGSLAWNSGYVYRILYHVAGQSSAAQSMPSVRFRVVRDDNQINQTVGVFSAASASAVPSPDGTTYEVYTMPGLLDGPAYGGASIAVDLLNLDPTDDPAGSIEIDWIQIEQIARSEIDGEFTSVYSAVFPADEADWSLATDIYPFNPVERFVSEFGLGLTSAGDFLTFGSLLSPAVPASGGKVYRLSAHTASSSPDAAVTPGFRLRLFADDNQVASILTMSSANEAGALPWAHAHKDYDLYLALPSSYGQTNVRAAFDLLHMDPFDSSDAIVYIQNVEIGEAAAPLFEAP